MFVLTFIASDAPLTAGHIAKFEGALTGMDLRLSLDAPVWLSKHKAIDLFILDKPNTSQMRALRAMLQDDHIDVLLNRNDQARRKKLLLADMDATIVTTETLDELAGYAGLQNEISALTTRAMNGELDFHEALRARVALLKGLPVTALHHVLMKTELSAGAETTVRTMATHGAICVLVSGGFTFFTGAIASLCGFHHHHGNRLGIENDQLNGAVLGEILDKNAKLSFLNDYAARQSLDLNETLATGDGANDLPMLQNAGLGVGYRPKQILADTLDNLILYADLTALLYAQGYKDAEFIHRQTH